MHHIFFEHNLNKKNLDYSNYMYIKNTKMSVFGMVGKTMIGKTFPTRNFISYWMLVIYIDNTVLLL